MGKRSRSRSPPPWSGGCASTDHHLGDEQIIEELVQLAAEEGELDHEQLISALVEEEEALEMFDHEQLINALVEEEEHQGIVYMDDDFALDIEESLLELLSEDDPNRYGTPASKSSVSALSHIKICSNEVLESFSHYCAVCKDEFELGMEANVLPCEHVYHPDCIIPWLQLRNSCPVCRYQLPTIDDPDDDQKSTEGEGDVGDSGGATTTETNSG